MAITKASAQTTVNSGTQAAAAATVNQITTAPATATVVAGGGSLGGVTISNVSITDSTFANVLSGDTAVSTAGGFVKITGTGFKTAANVFLGSTVLANTFVSATQINANIPATAAGTYQFTVFNTDGSGAIYSPGLTISGPPSWTTTSYSASTLTLNIQLLASGDAPLTYYIQPGSANPQNLAVNSAGYLSGTVSESGAYTITVIVDDAQNQTTQADINVTVFLSEPYFNRTILLLPGDNTNDANNKSFIDSSNNNFSITRNGNATQGSFTPFSQTGWSGYFTGATTSYIATPTTSILNQGQTYTVQCWIYPTSFTTSTSAVRRMYIFIFGVIYAGLSIHSDGTLGWYGWPTPAGMIVTSAAGTITTNEWQHVALVINPSGNSIKLFKNGVEVGSAAYTAAGANNSAIQIGHGDTSQATDGFIGYISNFKVTLSALTGAQLDYSATPTISSPTGSALLVLQTNRFNDTSANAFSITNGGVTSVQAFSPFAPAAQYSTGTHGGSGYFDGTGDYLSISSTAALNFGTGDFTVEMWIYMSTDNTNRALIETRAVDLSANGFVFAIEATGGRFLMVFSNSKLFTTSNSISLNVWTHVALTRTGTTMRCFINGVQGASVTNSQNYTNTAFTIGAGIYASSEFNGYISNLRLLKGTALYTSNFTPPTSPLTAVANTALLLNFTNAGVFDATGKNVVETVADAKISTAQSKFGGSSIAFDGTGDYLVTPSSPVNILGSGDFTIEFWAYPSNTSAAYRALVASENYAATTGGWSVYQNGASIEVWLSTSTQLINATSALTATTWQHVALSRTSGTVRLFVNGTSIASASNTAEWTGQRIFIGDNNYAGTDYFYNGYIDDLRITKGFARYTANFTPPTETFSLR